MYFPLYCCAIQVTESQCFRQHVSQLCNFLFLSGSVEKGVHEALKEGPMGGFPVVDVQVTLVDGKTHSVDSGDAAFFQAGILAVREALKKSESILLEPIMKMDADFPGKNTGAVSKDLSRRRGQVTIVVLNMIAHFNFHTDSSFIKELSILHNCTYNPTLIYFYLAGFSQISTK